MSGAGSDEESMPKDKESDHDASRSPSTSSTTTSSKDKDNVSSSGFKITKKGDRLIKEYVDVKTGKITVYEPGIKLEVSDYKGDWYPAKVLEVDYDENEVLIHYDKWSSRFDEWIKQDSNRLRPSSDTNVVKIQFKVGEKVEALWSTDGQKYPGTIKAIHPNDYYEVLFDDGIKCKKKVSQIFKLQRMTRGKSTAASSAVKETEKKPSLRASRSPSVGSATGSVPTILYPAKSALLELTPGVGARLGSIRKRRSRELSFSSSVSAVSGSESEVSDFTLQTETVKSLSSVDTTSPAPAPVPVPLPGQSSVPLHHHSIFDPISTDLGKRKRASHDYSLFLKIPKKPQVPKTSDSPGQDGVRRRARRSRLVPEEDVVQAADASDQQEPIPDDTAALGDLEENSDAHEESQTEESGSPSVLGMPLKRIRKSSMKAIENIAASPIPGERSPKRRMSRRGSLLPLEGQGHPEMPSDLQSPAPIAAAEAVLPVVETPEPEAPAGFVDDQGNLVTVEQTEDGGWICPIDKCGKHFRKDSLLQMHLKHYHPASKIHLQGNKLNRFEMTIARARGSRSRIQSDFEPGTPIPVSTTTSTPAATTSDARDTSLPVPTPSRRRRRTSGQSGHLTATVVAAAVAAVGSPEITSDNKARHSKSIAPEEEALDVDEFVLTVDSVEASTSKAAESPGGADHTEDSLLDASVVDSIDLDASASANSDVNTNVCVLLEKINLQRYGGSGKKRTGGSGSSRARVSQRGRILAPKKWNRIYSDTESDEDDDLLDMTDSSEEETKPVRKAQVHAVPAASVPVPVPVPAAAITEKPTSRKFRSQNQSQNKGKISAAEKKLPSGGRKMRDKAGQFKSVGPVENDIDDDRLIEEGEIVVTEIPLSEPLESVFVPAPEPKPEQKAGPSTAPVPSKSQSVNRRSQNQNQGSKLTFKLSRGSRDKNFMTGLTAKKLNLISQELLAMGGKKRLTAKPRFEDVRVDVINCECGLQEEFGLMMQCELCQAWQHGNCYEIFEVAQLPQYYVCSFCREPKNLRSSRQYEWYQEVSTTGRLPRFSFGPQNDPEQEDRMRTSNDLLNSISNIQSLLRSTQMKITMLNSRKDHPKLVLWSQEQKAPAVVARQQDFKSNFRSVLRQLLRYHCRDHAYIFRLRRKVEMKARSPNEEQIKIQNRLKNRLNNRAWQILKKEKRFQRVLKRQQQQRLQPFQQTKTSTDNLKVDNAASTFASASASASTTSIENKVEATQVEDEIQKIKSSLLLKSKQVKYPVLQSQSATTSATSTAEESGKQFLLLTKASNPVPLDPKASTETDVKPPSIEISSKKTEKGRLRRLTQTVQLPDGTFTKKIIGLGRIVDGVDGVKVVQLLSSTDPEIRRQRTVSGTGINKPEDKNVAGSANSIASAGASANKKLVRVDSVSKLGLCKTCKHSFKMDWKPKEFVKEENIHLIKPVQDSKKIADEAEGEAAEKMAHIVSQSQVELDLAMAALTEDLCGTDADDMVMADIGMGMAMSIDPMINILNTNDSTSVNINDIVNDNSNNGTGLGNSNGESVLSLPMSISSSILNENGNGNGSADAGEIKLKTLCEAVVGCKAGVIDMGPVTAGPSSTSAAVSATEVTSGASASESLANIEVEPKVEATEILPEERKPESKPERVEQPKRKRTTDVGITIPKKITGKSCRLNLHASIVREQALLDLHLDSIENKLKELESPKINDPRALLNKLKDLEELKKKVELISGKIEFMRNIRPDPISSVDATVAAAAAADSIVSTPISVPAE